MLTIRRAGFTVMEVLVALVLVVALTAIVLPGVMARVGSANSSSLAASLKTINTAILQYRENTGRYPGQLSELVTRPTTSSLDACGFTLASSSVTGWSGPYLSLNFGSNDVEVGDATISNDLSRKPLVATSSTMDGVLKLSVDGVTGSVDSDIEAIFDTGNDVNKGTITFIPTAGRSTSILGILTFAIPIRGC